MYLHHILTQNPDSVQHIQDSLKAIQVIKDSIYNSIPAPAITTGIPFVGSLVASAILGFLKKFVINEDSVVLAAIKPFQPILVTAGGILLPILGTLLHLDSVSLVQSLAVAPLGALAALVIREINVIATGKKS